MTFEYRPETIAVLRAIHVHGPITLSELEDMNFSTARKTALNLQTQKHIETSRQSTHTQRVYSVTPRGIRLLASLDVGKGEVAATRQPIGSARYTGEAATATRPGSMIAYTLPSRVGDELVERRRPILVGSAV